jgi:hypothetical protein
MLYTLVTRVEVNDVLTTWWAPQLAWSPARRRPRRDLTSISSIGDLKTRLFWD